MGILEKALAEFRNVAIQLYDRDEDRAVEMIRSVMNEMRNLVDEIDCDRYVAGFDANWDRIADNH